jgi:hypothetical protein
VLLGEDCHLSKVLERKWIQDVNDDDSEEEEGEAGHHVWQTESAITPGDNHVEKLLTYTRLIMFAHLQLLRLMHGNNTHALNTICLSVPRCLFTICLS